MNIIILNPFNKFPGSERWDFELINYEAFIDHSLHRVTYIADQRGLSGITADPESYHLIKISNFNEEEQLAQILEDEIQRLGKVDRIIAFSENHMDLVAQLREKHEIPGPGIAETERARDKVVMKQCLDQANLRVPYYLHLEPNMSQEKIAKFVAKVGFPLIFKPTNGASSVGVQKIEDEAQLQSALQWGIQRRCTKN